MFSIFLTSLCFDDIQPANICFMRGAMANTRVVALCVVMFCFAVVRSSAGQAPPQSASVQRDAQAIQILTQALSVAGGTTAIAQTHDYVAQGSITYYWAGEEVPATVTVKGRGTGQYRLDATLSAGVRTWAVSDGAGFVRDPAGKIKLIPFQNAVNYGSLTLPWVHLLKAIEDSTVSVTYIGLETRDGATVHHVRVQPNFTLSADPRGTFGMLARRDYFIDATAFTIAAAADMVHSDQAYTINFPHVIAFTNYQSVSGVLVPFTISETTSGQHTYTLQLTQIAFNSGLQDSDFQQ